MSENKAIQYENIMVKECPDCAETIKYKAKKCRFCGYIFNNDSLKDKEEHFEFADQTKKSMVGDIRPATVDRHSFGCTFLKLNNGDSALIKDKLLDLKYIVVEIISINQDLGTIKAIYRKEFYMGDEKVKNIKETASSNESVRCVKCRSTQVSANKKGYGIGKAAVGVLLTGGLGLGAGFIGAGKVRLTCLKCGHYWEPGNR